MTQLKKGDQGSEVRELQRLLRKRGYPVAVDGDFGRKTWEAVRAFQSQHLDAHGQPLTVDGKVGPVTWWALTHPKPEAAEIPVDFRKMPRAAAGGSRRGRKALSIAVAELKHGAGESGGDNRGADVRRYLAPTGLTEPNNWCAAFVSWCYLQACKGDQGRMPFAYSAGARALLKQFRDRDLAHPPQSGYSPLPGDLVVWWRVRADGWQGHVGLVHHVRDGMLYTIEGNHASKVQGFSYVLSRMEKLLGFGHAP
jgi:hypothetical protein